RGRRTTGGPRGQRHLKPIPMNLRLAVSIILLSLLAGIGLVGCSHHSSTPSDEGPRGAYYEWTQGGTGYVVGSIESLENLKQGKAPRTAPGGFSPQGQPLSFETDDSGLKYRLQAEYERRHPPQ